MKATGIVRKVDALGRLVLPIELREAMEIGKNDAVEIFTSGDMVILKKYLPADIFTGDMEELVEYKDKKVSKKNIRELAKLAGFKIVEDESSSEDELSFEIENPFEN
jgi:transcriptional pleiotropic regulator of transition state genes